METQIEMFESQRFRDIEYWFNEYGQGYGGYTHSEIFKTLIPLGYPLNFIKDLCEKLGMGYIRFEEEFKEYKDSPIIEFKSIKCSQCNHAHSQKVISYKRTGKYLNKKGKILKTKRCKF